MKHPDLPIVVGQSGDFTYRSDRHVLNTELRDNGETLLLNVESFKEDGRMKYFR